MQRSRSIHGHVTAHEAQHTHARRFIEECSEVPTAGEMVMQSVQLSVGGPIVGLVTFGIVAMTHSLMSDEGHDTCVTRVHHGI